MFGRLKRGKIHHEQSTLQIADTCVTLSYIQSPLRELFCLHNSWCFVFVFFLPLLLIIISRLRVGIPACGSKTQMKVNACAGYVCEWLSQCFALQESLDHRYQLVQTSPNQHSAQLCLSGTISRVWRLLRFSALLQGCMQEAHLGPWFLSCAL